MEKKVQIKLDGKSYDFPLVYGTEGEKAIDISDLRNKTGYISLDPGFANTGSCQSSITYLNGEKGIMRYRGIPIEQLAEHSTFICVAYLLIYGELPNKRELERFSEGFTRHSMIHEDMKNIFNGYPSTGHPMGILSAMVCSLSAFYPELVKPQPTKKEIDLVAVELLSKVRTICAFSYKKSIGEPFVYPRSDLKYIPNFLHMLFSAPSRDYKIEQEAVDALQAFFVLHADHEQNCSTSTVRLVSSSWANMFASVSAGICALWGPLHGGANQKVIEMLERIHRSGGNVKKYIDKAKDPNDQYRLMGFGHRVYKNYDPRAIILKKKAMALFEKTGHDPLLEIALKLEEIVLKDEYFVKRKLYPNVDFYSGFILRAIGIPTDVFPVMFAIGRMPGWIAQWKEMNEDPKARIGRPRQIYTGYSEREYLPLSERGK